MSDFTTCSGILCRSETGLLLDNSNVPFSIVAEASEDGKIIREPEKFSKIQAINEEYEKHLEEEKRKLKNVQG